MVKLWKVYALALIVVTGMLGTMLLGSCIKLKSADAALDTYIEADLRHQGYKPGRYVKPAVDDIPKGAHALVHATGSVRYTPGTGATVKTTSIGHEPSDGGSTLPAGGGPLPVPPPVPCRLHDLDIGVTCVLDTIQGPTKPFGRLMISGEIRGFGQVRTLPQIPAGDVELQVAPAAAPQTWRLDALGGAGIGSRVGAEFGLAWTGRSRWGGYTLAEWQPASGGDPSAWRVHAGARLRLK